VEQTQQPDEEHWLMVTLTREYQRQVGQDCNTHDNKADHYLFDVAVGKQPPMWMAASLQLRNFCQETRYVFLHWGAD
jgi:hypothetical protein